MGAYLFLLHAIIANPELIDASNFVLLFISIFYVKYVIMINYLLYFTKVRREYKEYSDI